MQVLEPVDVAQEVFDGVCSVAPQKGTVLQDEMNEARFFPTLFPSGRGTFHEPRKKKLTLCKFFNAQIHCINADGRFGKNLDYIFFA